MKPSTYYLFFQTQPSLTKPHANDMFLILIELEGVKVRIPSTQRVWVNFGSASKDSTQVLLAYRSRSDIHITMVSSDSFFTLPPPIREFSLGKEKNVRAVRPAAFTYSLPLVSAILLCLVRQFGPSWALLVAKKFAK